MSIHSNPFSTRSAIRLGAGAAALLAVLSLSACGGGGGSSGSTNFGGTTTAADTDPNKNGTTTDTGPKATAPSAVEFVSATPDTKSIVLQGQGGSGRTETATLVFKVTDTNGNPLINQTVDFSTTSPNVKLNTPSATTDKDGKVTTSVNSMTVPASFRVQATVSGTKITTMSDTMTVTTGLPVQNGFSISVDNFNFSGWDYDNSPEKPGAHVNVMLADSYGNPVADGTPVVFQINMGSIGSSDRGGCVTKNGGCTVDVRAQAPRMPAPNQPATACNSGAKPVADSTRPGIATVCASTSDGTNLLLRQTYLTFSGDHPAYMFFNGSNTPIWLDDPKGMPVIDVGSVQTGETLKFTFELDDVNFNALPRKTLVELVTGPGATGTYSESVGNIQPDPFANNTHQGSRHTFEVKSSAAGGGNCTPTSGDFVAKVNVPIDPDSTNVLVTRIPFKIHFTCP